MNYYGTLSGSHSRSFRIRHEKCVRRPWRKTDDDVISGDNKIPRHLGNHASQIKSYYETLPGSHGHSFRVRYENRVKLPWWKQITMISYPVSNQTSSFGNHALQLRSYYERLSESHGRSFRIRHEKVRAVPPVGGLTMTSCACNRIVPRVRIATHQSSGVLICILCSC